MGKRIVIIFGGAMGGAVLVILALYRMVKATWWTFRYSITQPEALRWAIVATFLLPVVAIATYWLGHRLGKEDDRKDLFSEGYRTGRLAGQRLVNQLREETKERGDAFLDGAKRGLGIADKVATTRDRVRQPPQQHVVTVQPAFLPPVEMAQLDDGGVIDV